MIRDMTDIDLDELRSELGDFAQPPKASGNSAHDQRIIAGFEEIERFVDEKGRLPSTVRTEISSNGSMRCGSTGCAAPTNVELVLRGRDARGLLSPTPNTDGGRVHEGAVEDHASASAEVLPSDEELLATLGSEYHRANDITELKHVRSRDGD